MQLTSPAFDDGGNIPSVYTCDGKNINPSLIIKDVPSKAKCLVLIMDDPDVPPSVRQDRLWVHWVIFDMPVNTQKIEENSTPPGTLGKGTGGKLGYQGPCPPDREHRYFFKLYALDAFLKLSQGSTKEDVEKAMSGHVIDQTQLMGKYDRKR